MTAPTQDQINVALDLPFDGLVSFHYYRADETMEQVTRHGALRLIADSGAFSAFTQGAAVSLDEYAEWLQRWRPHLLWAASLDVFGDPAATRANFRTLRDHHGLQTVPTLHIGADPALMDVYAAEGVDFLGLGGMVGMSRSSTLRWLVHVLRYARTHHPQMRFHAWGMANHNILNALPLYSVDSSGLLTPAYRYARLALWDPRRREVVNMRLDGRTPHRHHRLLAEHYNTPAKAVLRSTPDNRPLLMRMSIRSTQLRARHFQARHRIPPPHWGLDPARRDALIGTRMHAVLNVEDFQRAYTPLREGDPGK